LIEDIAAPDGIVFCLPVFGNDDLDRVVESMKNLKSGMEFTTAIATSIITGEFCYRHFDNAHSSQQATLEKEYGMKALERPDYEETGRIKKKVRQKVDIRGVPLERESTE
jgi:hypothetical protein